jgi:hypothetical protein
MVGNNINIVWLPALWVFLARKMGYVEYCLRIFIFKKKYWRIWPSSLAEKAELWLAGQSVDALHTACNRG